MIKRMRTVTLLVACALLMTSMPAFAGEQSGYLGVTLQNINASMAKALQMEDKGGVLVNEVVTDSPAEKAGFKDGDVVLEFDGQTITSNKALIKAVGGTSPGDEVKIKILRSGKTKTLKVVVGKKEAMKKKMKIFINDDDHSFHMGKDFEFIMKGFGGGSHPDRGFLGVQLDDLNEQLGKYFDVEDGEGALVTKITEDSAAEKAGLKAGDVIVRIGDDGITSADDVHQAMADTKPEDELKIQVLRKGKTKKFDVTLGEHQMHRMEFIEERELFDVEEVRMELEELRMELEELRKELQEK